MAGGILYFLLQFPLGYFMAPLLFALVLATRMTIADVQWHKSLRDQTLVFAARALGARDRFTESHSIRVSELAGRLTEHLLLGNR